MSIKPILFNTEMVRAIREGRKTQTRRIVRQPPVFGDVLRDDKGWYYEDGTRNGHSLTPPFLPGDILWVRETWTHGYIEHSDMEGSCEAWFEKSPVGCDGYIGALSSFMYRADDHDFFNETGIKYHPSIHMPKEAARIFLRVKEVRVERLQDMDEEAAIAEGFADSPAGTESPLLRFTYLWDKTIRRDDLREFGYQANPWVWVIEFERCSKPDGWCADGDKG